MAYPLDSVEFEHFAESLSREIERECDQSDIRSEYWKWSETIESYLHWQYLDTHLIHHTCHRKVLKMIEFYLILSSFKDYPNQLCSTSKNHLLNQSTDLWLFAFLRVECYVISIFHNKNFAISKALDNSANQILLFLPLKWARSWIGQKISSPVWLNVWHLFFFQTKKNPLEFVVYVSRNK